jgi:hypothetical protein
VIGTNVLAPTGSGAGLTGITAAQVGARPAVGNISLANTETMGWGDAIFSRTGPGAIAILDNLGNPIDLDVATLTVGTLNGMVKATAGLAGAATEGVGGDYLSGASNALPFSFGFRINGTPTIGTALVKRPALPFAMTMAHIAIWSETTPVGGPLTIVIKRSSDGGVTFPDTIATLSVTATNHSVTTTTFTTAALAAGDIVAPDITAVNGAADITVAMTALSRNQ